MKKILFLGLTATLAFSGVYELSEMPTINSATDAEHFVSKMTEYGPAQYTIVTKKSNGTKVCFSQEEQLQLSVEKFENTSDAVYYDEVVKNSNSYGAWVYFDSQDGGYNNGGTLASRGGNPKNFNFNLLSNGQLEIRIARSSFSTTSVSTSQPVPQNEWVYIQGHQAGNTYTVGWKKTDGTEHKISRYMKSSITNNPSTYTFHINDAKYATHIFWQPGVGMFTNMYDTDVSNSEIYVMDSFNVDVLSSGFQENLTYAMWPIEDSTLDLDSFDVYINSATQSNIYVDLRDKGCPSTLPPIF